MLGEAIALAAARRRAQIRWRLHAADQGRRAAHLLVADVTTAGALRGYAQFDASPARRPGRGCSARAAPARRRLLAFTVDQGEHTERYQGIVELQGGTLADCAHHYFRQSEQFQAGSSSPSALPDDGALIGAPAADAAAPADGRPHVDEVEEDGWRRAMVLMDSATSGSCWLPGSRRNDLLFRLFHEDGVRVFTPHALAARCRCSRERIERVLRALAPEETARSGGRRRGRVTCEFCSAVYDFDDAALDALVPG